jgi:hypothetical protein
MAEVRCLWCRRPFEPRRGGSHQLFCRPTHRTEFHTAARIWAERAIAAGAVTIADLRNGLDEACTLLSGGRTPVRLLDIVPADPAVLTALRRLGSMVLRLPIAPEGIAELVPFYDALEVNDSAVRVPGEPTLTKIARELVATVRKNVTIDSNRCGRLVHDEAALPCFG